LETAPRQGFRWFSRRALPAAATVVCVNIALLVDRTPEAERGSVMGPLSGSFDLGSVLGSLLVGFTVERVSFAAGFHTAAIGSLAGLTLFVAAERRVVLRRSKVGV
jgi:dipeptide/tripeptide permease